jgi:phage/plasmid-associated DNA primase
VSRCIKAVKKVIDNGYYYDVPDCCAVSKESYKIENNSVLRFIEECTEARTEDKYSGTPTTGQVYNAYKAWCKDNVTKGYFETAPTFKQILVDNDYGEIKRANGYNYYQKFVLKLEVKQQYGVYDGYINK